MTIYNRPRAEVFAENAPPSEIQPFQAWLRGLGIAFDETNGFPEMTGLNGLFNALNQYIKYLEQNGFAEWSSSLEYPVGAGVRVGSTWYRARTRNTNKPPATSQNDWAVFLNGADVASASTTVKGIVQLSNVLNSTSTSLALTAAQGKVLQDEKLDKSGGTVTGGINININADGGLNVNAGGTAQAQVRVSNSIHNGMLQASVGGNFGLYDTTFGKWIVHAKSSGDVELNGNAASATNASNVSRSIVAGNGLSGGGELNANRTITLGTPSTVTASTTNSTTSTSHTHNLDVNSLPLLGVGQTWQDVRANRTLGTTYTNSTGRPIAVIVSISDTTAGGLSVTVGGVVIISTGGDLQPGLYPLSFIVPGGASYKVVSNGNYLQNWAELR